MSVRTKLAAFLESANTTRFIMAVIILNAVTLGMETSPVLMNAAGPLIIMVDRICLTIFTV